METETIIIHKLIVTHMWSVFKRFHDKMKFVVKFNCLHHRKCSDFIKMYTYIVHIQYISFHSCPSTLPLWGSKVLNHLEPLQEHKAVQLHKQSSNTG